ncbi:MAG TPA: phage portal protein [Candidatus Atribacteria bacterium]|nr:phage portal protein [Candidatus Atribacteria bacterium]
MQFITFERPTKKVRVSKIHKKSDGRLKQKANSSKELSDKSRALLTSISSNDILRKYILFKDIMDTLKVDGFLKASIEAVSNAGVGAGWSINKHEDYFENAIEENRDKLVSFYNNSIVSFDNIKDFFGTPSKIAAALLYLKFFGQAVFHVLMDQNDKPIGIDFIYGFVYPNVDAEGNFEDPNFIQLSLDTGKIVAEYSANEIVYIVRPDITGKPYGDMLAESLSQYALPLDIYLQSAALSYLRKSRMPPAIWEVPEGIGDEEFDAIADYIEDQYEGPENVGKVPLVVSGEINVKRLESFPKDIPYLEARKQTREEIFTVIGTSARKLGLTEDDITQEDRKEFFETTMIPLFKFVEDAFYRQIHKRLFGILDWIFSFGRLDFLDAVERATVHMRYIQNGVLSPNDVRAEIGKGPRSDGEGDTYYDPAGRESDENQGSPPEGREDRPDKPSDTGEPTLDDQDPPRGDRRGLIIDELSAFQRFLIKRWNSKREEYVDFFWNTDDAGIIKKVQAIVSTAETKEEFIDAMEQLRRDVYVGEY